MRRLPGISLSRPKRSGPLLIRDVFDFPLIYNTPLTPQLIFPAQQFQELSSLSLEFRNMLEGRSAEGDDEMLERLKSIDRVRVLLRRAGGLMTRQLWRLQDLHNGGGLGFTTELFFLSVRRLLSISCSTSFATLSSKAVVFSRIPHIQCISRPYSLKL
ncbi:hypothetical protein H4582DRAFT_2001276 [Lactarius indigo]|nr:hypothetical protein H4582DRAFT_2001276 [Lactarius indigo]